MKNIGKFTFVFTASILILVVLSVFNLSNATTGIVNTPAVRIREKASTDSEILTVAYEDEEIEILGEEGDWYKVSVNGENGYASKSLIKLKDNSGTSNNATLNAKNTNTTNNKNTSSENNTAVSNSNNSNNTKNENTVDTNTTSNNTDNNSNNENSNEENNASNEITKVVINDTTLKLLPNFSSNDIKLLTKDLKVTLGKELNNWVEVTADNVTGWMLKNKLGDNAENPATAPEENKPEETSKPEENKPEEDKTEEPKEQRTSENRATGKIIVETANVREKADKSSNIIYRLDEGDEVTIVEEVGDWYKITNSEVSSGYLYKTLLKVSNTSSRGTANTRQEIEKVEQSNAISEVNTKSTNNGLEVVEFAKKYLGTSYVSGGKTPETGFDCSGYTKYIFGNFGYTLGDTASGQNSVGSEVSRENLKEGDLLLFYDEAKTKIGHTGIYIGNDQFIHSANPQRGVVIDNFSTNSYYSSRFITARRIVE